METLNYCKEVVNFQKFISGAKKLPKTGKMLDSITTKGNITLMNYISRPDSDGIDEINIYVADFSNSITAEQSIINALTSAKMFGNEIIQEIAVENIMLGITQAGQTGAFMDLTEKILTCLSTGSLYEALVRIGQITPISDTENPMYPFANASRLASFSSKISSYLGV